MVLNKLYGHAELELQTSDPLSLSALTHASSEKSSTFWGRAFSLPNMSHQMLHFPVYCKNSKSSICGQIPVPLHHLGDNLFHYMLFLSAVLSLKPLATGLGR